MKKKLRRMKKWIPKNTLYCYELLSVKRHKNKPWEIKTKVCKWHKYIKTIKLDKTNCEHTSTCKDECWTTPSTCCRERVYRCEYMNYTDHHEDSLLWDKCKECGVHEGNLFSRR